jgi:hypothetical protein
VTDLRIVRTGEGWSKNVPSGKQVHMMVNSVMLES